MDLELIRREPAGAAHPVPLLFVHGTNSGAWVWAEHLLDWFAAAGYRAAALSFRGHGASGGGDALDFWGIADYVADLATVIERLDAAPVLIGHSMGGMVVQRLMQERSLPGVVLMASLPPSGLTPLLWRMSWRDPVFLHQVTVAQTLFEDAPNAFATVRRMLFSERTPDVLVERYFKRWQRESKRAVFDLTLNPLPYRPRRHQGPMLVLGVDHDALVDRAAVRETALYHNTDPIYLPHLGHALMLEPAWETVAQTVADWLGRVLSR